MLRPLLLRIVVATVKAASTSASAFTLTSTVAITRIVAIHIANTASHTTPPPVMRDEAPAFLPAPPGVAAVHDGGADDGDPPDDDGDDEGEEEYWEEEGEEKQAYEEEEPEMAPVEPLVAQMRDDAPRRGKRASRSPLRSMGMTADLSRMDARPVASGFAIPMQLPLPPAKDHGHD